MLIKIATTPKEINDAYHVRKVVFVHEQDISIDEEMDSFDDEAIHFIGYVQNEPIAASRLRWVDNYGKLERLCVLKQFRGKSYGTKMIQKMEKETLNKKYKKTILNAQVHAIKFYENLGYQVISKQFMDAGIPHVSMMKNLN